MPRSSIGSGEGVCVCVGVNMGECGMCEHEYACVGVWAWICLWEEGGGGEGDLIYGKLCTHYQLHSKPRGCNIETVLCFRYELPLFIGLKDYSSDCKDNLCFRKGDEIFIINTEERDRWFALHKHTEKKGYIKRVYIQERLEGMRYI